MTTDASFKGGRVVLGEALLGTRRITTTMYHLQQP